MNRKAQLAYWRARSVLLRSGLSWEDVRAMDPRETLDAATARLRGA